MDRCVSSQVGQLKSELASALKSEGRAMDARTLVGHAESAWLKFVRAECRAEVNRDKGGSIYPLEYGTCERRLYSQRITQVSTAIADSRH